MKISKVVIFIGFLTFVILLVLVGKFVYSIGQHKASLVIEEATPKDLAEAMQGDDFYSKYAQTMLLTQGNVTSVNRQGNEKIVGFKVTDSPSVLPKVTCEFNSPVSIKQGNTILVLAVASDALRKNTADVVLQNCYLIKNTSL